MLGYPEDLNNPFTLVQFDFDIGLPISCNFIHVNLGKWTSRCRYI